MEGSTDYLLVLFNQPIVQFAILVVFRLLARLLTGESGAGKLVANLLFFAALTALLLYHRIPPYVPDISPDNVSDRVASGLLKAIWWGGGAMLLASLVRTFLIFERKPKEGRLLQDLVVGLIYVGATLSVISYVFSLPVRTIIATSGALAIILGLALQSTLNDVFSGIALNLGRPLSVGDWIVVDENTQGRVVETNWRSTELLSLTNDLVVVPNSVLAKSRITNISGPDRSHGATLIVRLLPNKPPAIILQAMERVLLSSNSIMKAPAPSANILTMDRSSLDVELSFRVGDLAQVPAARNELYDLVFRHVEAAGLQLSDRPGSIHVSQTPIESKAATQSSARRLMDTIQLFTALTPEEKDGLAATMNRLTFRKNDIVAHQGTALTSLMILRSGVMAIEEAEEGIVAELQRLAPGDIFGERGVLMGALELGDIRALTASVIYEIPKQRLADIMRDRPAIADELAALLSARTQAEEQMRIMSARTTSSHNASSLSVKIKHLFRL
ncbi:mechanosensitive ion channel family protein [Agrobacterium tumefaciens]|uniref:mechanosensitive ion channel family protein n=1 Tax=Agrobacterium tumefaciens TaxID=358 RepID=UPI00287C60B8|nr:mechanosensitive ion channel family protein [Agrobacterium tumefaciens]MDS7595483.1 mechanosensitive ion channel family protein [Agrobacterium tumefaciens]